MANAYRSERMSWVVARILYTYNALIAWNACMRVGLIKHLSLLILGGLSHGFHPLAWYTLASLVQAGQASRNDPSDNLEKLELNG
jgi:phosphotransferase system  glucose/maltose/N-acetylglucosamine-specific IIC component